MLGPMLRGVLGALEREDMDGPGVTVLTELLRLDEIDGLETAGGRTDREPKLLLGPRLL
jgi:hypothetical protein